MGVAVGVRLEAGLWRLTWHLALKLLQYHSRLRHNIRIPRLQLRLPQQRHRLRRIHPLICLLIVRGVRVQHLLHTGV